MVAYKIENKGDPVVVKTNVLPFEPKDQQGNIRIKKEFEGPVRFSLDNSNIQLDQPYLLKTKDSQQILLRIRIPEGAPLGDYYYTLLAETQPSSNIGGNQSTLAKATIGSNILITVTESGRVEARGKITLFNVLPRFKLNLFDTSVNLFDSTDKIPVVLVVENTGKNLIKPNGNIVLRGNFGEKAEYEIIGQNILAESQRQLAASPSAMVDCEENEKKAVYCQKSTSLVLSGFFVGLYKLSASLTFGENSPRIFSSASFIALPFKFLIGIFIALAVAWIIIKKISKDNDG